MACDFCNRFDFSTAKIDVDKYNARILLALCNTKFDTGEQFKYCPNCGEKINSNKTISDEDKQKAIDCLNRVFRHLSDDKLSL